MTSAGFSLTCRLILVITIAVCVVQGPFHVTGNPLPDGAQEAPPPAVQPEGSAPQSDAAAPSDNQAGVSGGAAENTSPQVSQPAPAQAAVPASGNQKDTGGAKGEQSFASISVGETKGTKDSNTTYYTHSTQEKFESRWGTAQGPPSGQQPQQPQQPQGPPPGQQGPPAFNFAGQNPFQFMFG